MTGVRGYTHYEILIADVTHRRDLHRGRMLAVLMTMWIKCHALMLYFIEQGNLSVMAQRFEISVNRSFGTKGRVCNI
jgi:hypothetical protein